MSVQKQMDPPGVKKSLGVIPIKCRNLSKLAIIICLCGGFIFSWRSGRDIEAKHEIKSVITPKTRLDYSKYQDKSRFLLLPSRAVGAGLNNQLECLHLAANLALRYNRTLLTQPDAYVGPKYGPNLGFDDVFDRENIPFSVSFFNDINQIHNFSSPIHQCTKEHRIERKHTAEVPLENPLGQYVNNHSEVCVIFNCQFAHLHLSAPKASFPYIDDNLLPLNGHYGRIADQVLKSIKDYVVSNSTKSESDVRILGIHMRGGDNPGNPSVDCSLTKKYPYLLSSRLSNKQKTISWAAVYCSSSPESGGDILSWETFLLHLNACDGEIPLCIKEFDAVFFATNDRLYKYRNRHNLEMLLTNTKIFYFEEFPFVEEELMKAGVGIIEGKSPKKIHGLAFFLVEMSILMRTNYFQSSIPSSISDIVYHYRQKSGSAREESPYRNWVRMYNRLLFGKVGKEACSDPCF